MQIHKSELIEILAARNGITVTASENYLNSFFKLVYETLSQDGAVNISGFGKFSISHRLPREGVNPRTGERMMLPEYNTPKFRSGQAFKAAVNLENH